MVASLCSDYTIHMVDTISRWLHPGRPLRDTAESLAAALGTTARWDVSLTGRGRAWILPLSDGIDAQLAGQPVAPWASLRWQGATALPDVWFMAALPRGRAQWDWAGAAIVLFGPDGLTPGQGADAERACAVLPSALGVALDTLPGRPALSTHPDRVLLGSHAATAEAVRRGQALLERFFVT